MNLCFFPSSTKSFASMALCIILILFYFFTLSYPFSATVPGNESDRAALLDFKSKMSESSVSVLSSWNDSLHFCQWFGVTCSHRHQRVIRLDLSAQNLLGTLSPFIGNLSFLQYFNISNNIFHGAILPEIGQLSRVHVLDLISNSFEGMIPSNISSCSLLTELLLDGNHLTGEIPHEVSFLPKLEFIGLSSNYLRGKIPASIGNASSLRRIVLTNNKLEGQIPDSIGRLLNMITFAVGQNSFTGVFPQHLYNISTLEIIDLDGNDFFGNLRHDFGFIFLNLRILQLGGNQFTGFIPASLSNVSNLKDIDLPTNNFVGNIPSSFGNLIHLESLNVPTNLLGRNGTDDLSFIASLTNCSRLQILDVSANQFGGNLPHSISNLSTDLHWLQLAQLGIGGNIPTDISRLVNLNKLDLGNNNLSSNIPASIGMLSKLNDLRLMANKLTGTIPSSLGNLTQILILALSENYLKGSIPSSLGRCQNLEILILGTNNFTGRIPKAVMHLKSLWVLDLLNNSLGSLLPSEIGGLQQLVELDVSNNRFSGNIPRELGSCLMLQEIYMQGNIFEGSIPDLSQLKGLKIIDLSHNNLSGGFPKYMVNFTSLQLLNLSFNNLKGDVPVQGVFQNISAVEVYGNRNLCGGIQELHLKPCPKQKHGILRKMKLLIIIVCSVLVFGFCLISLFLGRKRQNKLSLSSPTLELFPKFSYTDLYNATAGFSATNLIGTGKFSTVYRGIVSPGETPVAVKVLNLGRHGSAESFLAECQAMAMIRHRNIVKVLTTCSYSDYRGNEFKALVYQFMKHGSLDTWLHPEDRQSLKHLSFLDRINIAVDVSSALCYLQNECPTTIVHCDLKPGNILLDDDMTAHIGDFGLARLLPDSSNYAISNQFDAFGIRGTIGYTAPEYGMGGDASTFGDVYSYGILILELFTGRRPTNELFRNGFNIQTYVRSSLPERVMDIVDKSAVWGELSEEATSSRACKGNWSGRHIACLISIFQLGIACSVENPRDRLSMTQVTSELHHIREKFCRR